MSLSKDNVNQYEDINDKIMQLHLELDDIYSNYEKYKSIKNELIIESFKFHIRNNKHYCEYAKRMNIDTDMITEDFDIDRIPLLPSAFFKRNDLELLSTNEESIIKYCQSSGTSGSLSIIPRDEPTMSNFLGSISSILPTFLGLERTGQQKGFVLGPTTEEAGDLWFSYVISCVSLMMQTECMEKNGVIDMDNTCQSIEEAILSGKSILIIGPPFKILELCEKIAQKSNWPRFPEKSFVISAGGWKNRLRESINDVEFRKIVRERMKIESFSSIRDIYNMVELNTILPECEFHCKHIPPWVEVVIRDPSTNRRLENGQIGIISFLDSSSLSYPGFILSEDIGYVQENECECGRKGQTLKIIRRMNNIESRGCALKMAVGAEKTSTESGRFIQSIYRTSNI